MGITPVLFPCNFVEADVREEWLALKTIDASLLLLRVVATATVTSSFFCRCFWSA